MALGINITHTIRSIVDIECYNNFLAYISPSMIFMKNLNKIWRKKCKNENVIYVFKKFYFSYPLSLGCKFFLAIESWMQFLAADITSTLVLGA